MEELYLLWLLLSGVLLWLFATMNIASSVFYPGNNKIHKPVKEKSTHTLLWSLSFLSQRIRRRFGYSALWASCCIFIFSMIYIAYSYIIKLSLPLEFKGALIVLIGFFIFGFILGYISFYGIDGLLHRIFKPNLCIMGGKKAGSSVTFTKPV